MIIYLYKQSFVLDQGTGVPRSFRSTIEEVSDYHQILYQVTINSDKHSMIYEIDPGNQIGCLVVSQLNTLANNVLGATNISHRLAEGTR